jgi:hypothetical protein
LVLANPPFGGKERREVRQNFSIRTGETAFLLLQHFIKILKAGGVVVPNHQQKAWGAGGIEEVAAAPGD